MQWRISLVFLAVFVYGGGGVTVKPGIDQFWTDDYKIFDQVYGKTSDREIYGETLPSSIISNNLKKQASNKNERYLLNFDQHYKEEPINLRDKYNSLLNKNPLKLYSNKPATSSINFISYTGFKPISKSNDPETYNYLKHLEEYSKANKFENPFDTFKPVTEFKTKPELNFVPYRTKIEKPEETDAYKSIQDILDAHEANKGETKNDNEVKYLNNHGQKRKPVNSGYKRRCVSGRCRKRSVPYRRRPRPYIKTVHVA